MLYNSNDKTIDLAKELEKKFNGNSRVIALKCPVDDPKAVAEVTQKVVDEFGRIDVYVGVKHKLAHICDTLRLIIFTSW
jgi:NAD(P)-dependent dehydrogenase (short-subunit alcohol dehydrogenase family)